LHPAGEVFKQDAKIVIIIRFIRKVIYFLQAVASCMKGEKDRIRL
jgi:hypothetical protein